MSKTTGSYPSLHPNNIRYLFIQKNSSKSLNLRINRFYLISCTQYPQCIFYEKLKVFEVFFLWCFMLHNFWNWLMNFSEIWWVCAATYLWISMKYFNNIFQKLIFTWIQWFNWFFFFYVSSKTLKTYIKVWKNKNNLKCFLGLLPYTPWWFENTEKI